MGGKRGTIAERLDRRLDKSGDCWVWTGYSDRDGYGRIGDSTGKMLSTHRVAWELANGPIPDGMYVLHSCDNPPCCKPADLHLGTHADNMREKNERGRPTRMIGVTNPAAKLTEAQVLAIRERYAAGGVSQKALGREYSISETTIWEIVKRRKWAWLDAR